MKRCIVLLLLLWAGLAGAQPWRASVLCAPADAALDPYGFGAEGGTVAATIDSIATDSTETQPTLRRPVVASREKRQPSVLLPIVGGVIGGVVGAYGGAIAGNSADHSYDDISVGVLFGFLIGESIVMPIGVHLGNARHGNFLADLGTSLVMQVAAIGLSSAGDGGYLVGLASQLALTVVVEREAGRKHLAREAATGQDP